MSGRAQFFIQAYQKRDASLEVAETIDCGSDEDRAFRLGRSMAHRVAGVAFFRIDAALSGDQWVEVEMLCATGEVPSEDAA